MRDVLSGVAKNGMGCFVPGLLSEILQVHVQSNVLTKQDQTLFWTCAFGAHVQCENNQYAKFKYTGMKSVLAT